MKRGKLRRVPCALVAFGLLAALVSMGILTSTPDALQYAVAAPQGENDVRQALTAKEDTAEQLADCTEAVAIGAVSEMESVSAGGESGSATVYAVGEGWFEVHPVFLRDGRRMTETELKQGDRVALLDENLAFSLFGSELPEDAKASIGGEEYAVIGTVRHRRSVGEAAPHCAYVPLLSEPDARRDVLMIAAKPVPGSGARTMFETTMRSSWRDDGSFYSIEKEAMRQMMLPRMIVLVFGMSAILAMFRGMNRAAAGMAARYREKLRWNYFNRTFWMLARMIVLCLMGYCALLALLYGLASFSIEPLTVFTEWVPENIVEWSSLKDVFWNLTGNAAKLVKVGTREMRIVEFWGRILRWGVLSALYGALLLRRRGI